MANNRIGFRCNVCGKYIPLAKSMGEGYYLSPAFSEENLEEFLNEHTYCSGEGGEGDFALAYEFPDEGQIGMDSPGWAGEGET